MTSTYGVAVLLSKKKTTAQTILAQFSVKSTAANSEEFKFTCMQELALIMYTTTVKPHSNKFGYSVCHERVCFVVYAKNT